jgi:hypothetical protein
MFACSHRLDLEKYQPSFSPPMALVRDIADLAMAVIGKVG